MRDITQKEAEKIHRKLISFIGEVNLSHFISTNSLKLHNQNIYLVSATLLKAISNIPKPNIHHIGLMIGRITKTGNFYLHCSALKEMDRWCIHKVWVKKSAEMNVLYGNNILKSHISKISDDLKANTSLIIYNEADVILGFGITTKDSAGIDRLPGSSIAAIVQSDNGVYLREE